MSFRPPRHDWLSDDEGNRPPPTARSPVKSSSRGCSPKSTRTTQLTSTNRVKRKGLVVVLGGLLTAYFAFWAWQRHTSQALEGWLYRGSQRPLVASALQDLFSPNETFYDWPDGMSYQEERRQVERMGYGLMAKMRDFDHALAIDFMPNVATAWKQDQGFRMALTLNRAHQSTGSLLRAVNDTSHAVDAVVSRASMARQSCEGKSEAAQQVREELIVSPRRTQADKAKVDRAKRLELEYRRCVEQSQHVQQSFGELRRELSEVTSRVEGLYVGLDGLKELLGSATTCLPRLTQETMRAVWLGDVGRVIGGDGLLRPFVLHHSSLFGKFPAGA